MKIFLSYGHDENYELVKRIRADLERNGHDCWIDADHIKGGDDWRRSITDGILDSQWVLSFLSRHACREWDDNGQRKRGVCLDEIAIAVGTRGSIVKTILVENPSIPDTLSPPLTVSNIQYLDLHDWKSKKSDGDAVFESWYQDKFGEILRVVNDPSNQKLGGEIETLRGKLQPMENAARIGELMANGFVGREWLLEEVIHWLNHEPQQKIFCLTGEPGFGKSAISAWLAYQNRPEVIAAHFCQYGQSSSDPRNVIRSIAFQMATRMPDYRRFLVDKLKVIEAQGNAKAKEKMEALLSIAKTGGIDPGQLAAMISQVSSGNPIDALDATDLFNAFIADAKNMLIDGGRRRYLVVIDALDEAGRDLVAFLAQNQGKLPNWLALFVTSRPNDPGIRQHLNMLNPHFRDVADTRNQMDARAWISSWLASRKLSEQQQRGVLEPLLSASHGNFHYLRTFRHMVEQDSSLLDKPDAYPQGLDSLYLAFFERQFSDIDTYQQWQAPFLRLVVASEHPLPLWLAKLTLDLSDEDFKIRVLQPLGSLFKIGGEMDQQTIEPFHKSLRDWMSEVNRAGSYYVDLTAGRISLSSTMWDVWAKIPNAITQAIAMASSCTRRHYLQTWEFNIPVAQSSPSNLERLTQRLLYPQSKDVWQTKSCIREAANPEPLFGATIDGGNLAVKTHFLLPSESGEWQLVLVSPSTSVSEQHLNTLAIQLHCLRQADLSVSKIYVDHIDNNFVYRVEGDYKGLICEVDVTQQVQKLCESVPQWIELAYNTVVESEPTAILGRQCDDFGGCSYLDNCNRGMPEYTLDIFPFLRDSAKQQLRAQGFLDALTVPESMLNERQRWVQRLSRERRAELLPAAKQEMEAIPYPRYYLDMETITFEIPRWLGTRPYMQIPYLWSCYIEDSQGELSCMRFMNVSGVDPRRGVAESLLDSIPQDGSVIVYSGHFERHIISGLAECFPDLADALHKVSERMVDLLPIAKANYYHPSMKGSWSIKKILPVIVPDLNYDDLEVSNGGLAQEAYLEVIDSKTPKERAQMLAEQLLEYSGLDSLAEVRLAQFLQSGGKSEKGHATANE